MLWQGCRTEVSQSLVGIVRDPLQQHLRAIIDGVAGLPPFVPGQSHAAGVDDRELPERSHALNMSMSQQYKIFLQPLDPLLPLVRLKVVEHVALRRRMRHAEMASLPLEPMQRGQTAQEVA